MVKLLLKQVNFSSGQPKMHTFEPIKRLVKKQVKHIALIALLLAGKFSVAQDTPEYQLLWEIKGKGLK